MSNYTKSFNFRNGVQVDDDRFVVNAVGLVGIGTTRPKTLLDVQGPANISGIASLSGSVVTGVVTAGVIKIDAVSGIITATKFVGDAAGLQNIVAIATDGWIANTGSLSTTAKIGIGTLSPNSQLDVVGDTNIVGFTTLSGITTSTGTLFVNQLSASGISSLIGHAKLNTVQVTGLATFTSVIDANGGAGISSIRIGVTGSNEIDTEVGNLTLDSASGQTTIDDNLIVSGILTANDYSGPAGTAATFTNGINVSSSGLTVTGVTTFNDETDSTGFTSGSILISGGVGFAKTSYFADNSSLIFGNDGDLEIVHVDNSNIIRSTSPSNRKLFIQNENQVVISNIDDDEQSAVFNIGAGVTLKHNNSTKFETTSTGAIVTGILTATSFSGSGANLTDINDSTLFDSNDVARVEATTTGATLTGIATIIGGDLNSPLRVSTSNDFVGKFSSTDASARLIIQDNSSKDNSNGIQVNGNILKIMVGNPSGNPDAKEVGRFKLDGSQNPVFECIGNIVAFTSDIRLKDELSPITKALEKVKSLNGFTYKHNETAKLECGLSGDERYAGVSAQDVQKVLPEVVKPAPSNNDYLTVQYEKLVPLLIEAIKELSTKVDNLEKQINN